MIACTSIVFAILSLTGARADLARDLLKNVSEGKIIES